VRSRCFCPWKGILNERRLYRLIPIDQGLPVEHQVIKDEKIARSNAIIEGVACDELESSGIRSTVARGISTSWYQPEVMD
jgi:hypothetical protein